MRLPRPRAKGPKSHEESGGLYHKNADQIPGKLWKRTDQETGSQTEGLVQQGRDDSGTTRLVVNLGYEILLS